MNPPWEETMDEEDIELDGIQRIIRNSRGHVTLEASLKYYDRSHPQVDIQTHPE